MAPLAPSTGTRRSAPRSALGYAWVGGVSVVLGLLGTIPFVIFGYAVVQWVLAPLGLAAPDSSNDDGVVVLLVSGVLLPLLVVVVWVAVVRGLTRHFDLVRPAGWVLALVGLLVPVIVFVAAKSA